MVPARSSTFSMDSFSTLDGVVYQEPCRPSPIIHRQGNLHLQIPEDIELTSYPPQKDLNSPQWSDSQHSTLVGETSVSPTARFLTSPFTTSPISAKKSNLDLPNSESVQYPPKIHAKWEKVRDPVALMGLTPYGGLPHAAKSSKLVGLEGKPLHAIFDKLDPCSATCLGLTCRKMIVFLKYRYHDKVSLYEPSPPNFRVSNNGPLTLGDLLETWIGPRYRRVVWELNSIQIDHEYLPPQFLLRDIYGPCAGGLKEIELAKRYLGYCSDPACRVIEDKYVHMLPHPHNKGKYWDVQARDAIKNDAKDFRNRRLWHWNKWMSHWMPLEVFGTMSYMEKLHVLQWFEFEEYVQTMDMDGTGRLLLTPDWTDKLWWTGKRYLRWISWWIGDLPERQPFPGPEPGQLRKGRSLRDSVLWNRRYRESALL